MVRDLTAATRESFISNSNATTYPSTFSSGQPSYLGLSDSPHHSSHPHSANSSDGYAPPPSPWRRRRTLRDANVPEEVFTPVDKPLPPVQTRQRPSHTFVFAGRQSLSADGQRSQTVPAAQQDVRPRRSRPDLRSSTSHNSIHAVREAGETEQRVYSSPTRQSAERPQGQRPVVKRRSGLSQSTTAVDNFPARSEEPRGIPAQATPTREIRSTPDRGRQHETEARASPTKQSKESSSGWLQTPERRTPVKASSVQTPTRNEQVDSSGRHIAVPVRRKAPSAVPASSTAVKPAARRAASPVQSAVADDWETELIKNAERLQIDSHLDTQGQPPRREYQAERDERRAKDAQWERSGLWETQRDVAREAEERTRRDAGRAIAYPPMQPRVPIRAAPTGVTSIHVGIRPRIHPSRAKESMQRNQPDVNVPVPMFTPLQPSQAVNLPGEDGQTVKGSYNTHYSTELLDKAKAEYEAWLSRKSEREGGIGDVENSPVSTWQPRSLDVARPGEKRPYVESFDEPRRGAAAASRSVKAVTPTNEQLAWNHYGQQTQEDPNDQGGSNTGGDQDAQKMMAPYGYPGMMMPMQGMTGHMGGMGGMGGWTQEDLAQYYAQQGYWDPQAFYWAAQMPQMSQMPNGGYFAGQPTIDQGQEQGKGKGLEVEKTSLKVHFAELPDKTRLKTRTSQSTLTEEPPVDEEAITQGYVDP